MIAIIPILFNRNFYFIDDTQSGSTGPWHYLGERILAGDFSLLSPSSWASGNWIIEGQFGLFSPITWMVGLCSLLFESVWLYATIVKIFFIVVVAFGTYKSAKILGASSFFAILVGISAPFCGFSSYFDQTAWFSGLLMTAVCVNYFWTSRLVDSGKISPAVPMLIALLGIAVGYFYISMLLVIITSSQLLAGMVKRSSLSIHLVTLVTTLLGTIAMYLPAILSASVTSRSQQGLGDSGFLQPDVKGLITNFIPITSHFIQNFGPVPMIVPVMYGSILFALLVFAKSREIFSAVKRNLDITLFLLFEIALMFGPTDFGPLHWPIRLYPLFITFALLLLASAVGRVEQFEIKKSVGFFVATGAVFLGLTWDQLALNPPVFASNLFFLITFLAVWAVILKSPKPKISGRLLAFGLSSLMLVSVCQHVAAPKSPLPDFGLPEKISGYKALAELADGETIFIGGWSSKNKDSTKGSAATLVGNSWLLTGKKVVNGYNYAGYANFTGFLTENYLGEFGEYGLWRLLAAQNVEGNPTLADLMQLDTIVAFRNGSISYFPPSPENWSRDDSNSKFVVYKRLNKSLRTPFHLSPNAEISDVRMSNDSISFRYSTKDNKPATFIFPRLAWPGFKSSVGELVPRSEFLTATGEPNPANKTSLLELKAPPGKNVSISIVYEPPAWNLSKILVFVILGILVLVHAIFRITKRRKIPLGTRRTEKSGFFSRRTLPSSGGKISKHRTLLRVMELYSIEEIRYVLFGVLNTAFGYLSFVVASQIVGQQFSPSIILLIGLAPAVVFAYVTQRVFIWRSKGAVRAEAPKFLAVTFSQFGINAVMLEFLVSLNLGVLLSQTLLTITLPIATFFAHKFWTFRNPKAIAIKQIVVKDLKSKG